MANKYIYINHKPKIDNSENLLYNSRLSANGSLLPDSALPICQACRTKA